MRQTAWTIVGAVALLALSSQARAQQFFGGGGTSFDPQISIVNSGTVLDAQPVVSADRKYVTMTMRPSLSTLVALRDFAFQNGNGSGVVGMNGNGVNGNGGANGNPGVAAGAKAQQTVNNSKKVLLPALAKPAGPTPVLMQEGMHRVDQPVK